MVLLNFENFAFVTLLAIGVFTEGRDNKTKTLPLTISLLNLVHAYFTGRHTPIWWKLLPFILGWGLSQKNLKGVDALLDERIDFARVWLDTFGANYETGLAGTSLLQVLASEKADAPGSGSWTSK